jgi:hypothetical protein
LRRGQLSGSILEKVDRFALYPPSDTTEMQWAVLVYWTHNLHCNSIPQVYAPYASLQELDRFLDDALANGPDRLTIDGLWDRHAAIGEGAARYRREYKPVRDAAAKGIDAEDPTSFNYQSYRGFLDSVRERNRR